MARLTPEQALYHFLSGYTCKLAGTEVGLKDPEVTFSPCYGAPFMALNPTVYAELLEQRLRMTGAQTWLINTGWTGGKYGVGKRIAIQETRKMVRAVLNDLLAGAEYRKDPVFGFEVPLRVPGVDTRLLDPRAAWADPDEYDRVYRGWRSGLRRTSSSSVRWCGRRLRRPDRERRGGSTEGGSLRRIEAAPQRRSVSRDRQGAQPAAPPGDGGGDCEGQVPVSER